VWRVFLKLTFLLLGIVAIIPLGLVCHRLKRYDLTAKIGQYYFKYAAWVIGLRVMVKGIASPHRPLILVSNHISYLDIIALGSIHPMIFTPKAEIASWPLIGWLCRLMGCVFIERKKHKTGNNLTAIEQALDRNIPLLLFAEGTTSDSKRILPIRSSYFKIVEDHKNDATPVAVQPIFLRYTRVHNLPIDLDSRHKIAWYGDMDLAPHASELFQLGPIEAEVVYLDEIDITTCNSRKEIAATCENALVNNFNNLH
jgi:1-acyl-sn-glycerol-3-phosphate acyltransferase